MGFLLPSAFAFAALALPIILFYMLKLRRQPANVSTLMLWQQVIEDKRANAPWQRIKRNLLLFLQLLILALLVMALARPYFKMASTVQGSVVLLLDASASMQATDVRPNRFAVAQDKAIDIINQLGADDAVTLIAVAQTPQILASSTTDHNALRQLIRQAEATNGPADWNAGLTLAAANAATLPDATVVLISDGALHQNNTMQQDNTTQQDNTVLPLPTMPVEVEFISVGASANNQGLVALSLRDGPDSPHLFLTVQNADTAPARRLVEIQVNGSLFDARWIDLPAEDQASLTLSDLPLDTRSVQATLTGSGLTDSDVPNGSDALAADDIGWAVRSSAPTKILLVSQSNLFLERVLTLLPGATVQRADPTQPLPQGTFDLVIFDRVDLEQISVDTLPESNLFFIAPTMSTPLFEVSGQMRQPRISHIQGDDPLLSYVKLNDARVAQAQVITPPPWARTLIGSAEGPLLLAGEHENRRIAILAFDLHQSNLPLQIDFPILIVNLARWLLPNSTPDQAQMLYADQRVELPITTSADRLLIKTPQGDEQTILSDQRTFDASQGLGIYQVFALQDNQTDPTYMTEFAVNLLNESETDIQPRPVSLGVNRANTVETESLISEWEWWWVLVLLGLGLLMVEWWIYWQGRVVGELQ